MVKKEQEPGPSTWALEHVHQIGATVITGAFLGTLFGLYELRQKRRKNLEVYMNKSDLFEFDTANPDKRTQMLRSVAAASLTLDAGASKKEIQKRIDPNPRRNPVGPAMFTLVSKHILERIGDDKDQIVRPHPDFLAAVADHPGHWKLILEEASRLDDAFDAQHLLATVALPPEIPTGNS